MLLSMTGYGRATLTDGGKNYNVEIRALNSKQSDLRLRTTQQLHAHEIELRKLVLASAKRGKLEMMVEIADESGAGSIKIDLPLLGNLTDRVRLGLNDHVGETLPEPLLHGLVTALLRTPGVIDTGSSELTPADWTSIRQTTLDCLDRLRAYRLQEGKVLAGDLRTSVRAIRTALDRVGDHAEDRIARVRERMERHLTEYLGRANVDKNRYEQEVLFYLEKMDINEERVRLAQNCDYFLEILDNDDEVKGRKLNFIGQEIGREINTLGAKAYSADIQKLVVGMKEQLEQVKEQLANVA